MKHYFYRVQTQYDGIFTGIIECPDNLDRLGEFWFYIYRDRMINNGQEYEFLVLNSL